MTATKLAHLIQFFNNEKIYYAINIGNNVSTHAKYIGAVTSCGKHNCNDILTYGIYAYTSDLIIVSATTIFTLSDGQKVAFFEI